MQAPSSASPVASPNATSSPLRVAVLTAGRFWLCDLARELTLLGHQVAFYSYVPPWRSQRFGLPRRCSQWLLPWAAPSVVAARAFQGTRYQDWADEWLVNSLDELAAQRLQPCDVFIGLSGMSSRAAQTARTKYGARILIERGSRHILSQQEILQKLPRAHQVPDFAVRRELADYELADVIVIPSLHVERSFLERGIPQEKLFRNPFGVDLKMFQPTPTPPSDPPTIVTTGSWSLRKGCDILTTAWRQLDGVRLLHVGPVHDCPLPKSTLFEHVATVEQSRLPQYYSRGHVFALASREEGLAMVLPQALACGLRLVCTDRTGGADLGAMIPDRSAVRVVPTDDPNALADALRVALADARAETGFRDRLGTTREELSWTAYGRRYDAALRSHP